MSARTRRMGLLAACLALVPLSAVADRITPAERVKSRLNVRAEPAAGSRVLGAMRPGEQLELVDTLDGWHRVKLDDDAEGFVAAAYSDVIEAVEPAPPAEIPYRPIGVEHLAPKPGPFTGVGRFFRRLFGIRGSVDLVIAEPAVEHVTFRHTDPDIPVSGYARANGASRRFDVMLVLDASTSTNEFAETDVDLDGEPEDAWKGDDSIYKAQLSAAASFVGVLAELPYNRSGQRIRVGIVTCSGDDRHRRSEADEALKVTLETIRWLSHRDAKLEMPLTSDYAALDNRLRELWTVTPVGMTDVAAGIGRAVIELSGDSLRGAESATRVDADKIILYLGDGKPRLPYNKRKAERAAAYAGELAARYDIRINVFELGENVVSRSKSHWLKRMARHTGGRHVGLARPGEIVAALKTTPLSFVDRVEVRNRTTEAPSPRVVTAIDGSFYTEVPLVEGANRIQVEATLEDGGTKQQNLVVAYRPGTPTSELERQLKELRIENAALIERVRADLAEEMKATSRFQDREVDLSIENPSD
ncbi:MAG: SH3 domain-containing protein [Deltaproteobacteria bacterium]|nr:SH3 domain-containing protein [Deltaproteobacteria bacterium]MBW2398756.1 SH3 domain-containing protein [Deltaproteobacteria bacterium]